MLEYKIIKDFYGTQKTKRSKVSLINHIDEGLQVLEWIAASENAKKAYCLHPILQSDQAYLQHKTFDFSGVSSTVLILTMEYRRVANSYLSYMDKESFVGFSCEDVKAMLIADKVQNYKDFMQYHYLKHEKSNQLYHYFHQWFEWLDIDINVFLNKY